MELKREQEHLISLLSMEDWNAKEFGTRKMTMNTKIAAMMKPAPLTVRNNYELIQLKF